MKGLKSSAGHKNNPHLHAPAVCVCVSECMIRWLLIAVETCLCCAYKDGMSRMCDEAGRVWREEERETRSQVNARDINEGQASSPQQRCNVQEKRREGENETNKRRM